MTTVLPAPTGYTIPQVRDLGESAARTHIQALLGKEAAELPLTLKRQERSRDKVVPWTNHLLYELTGSRRTVGIVVEVDEHHHSRPNVVQDQTRIVRGRTLFLAAGWPKRIQLHLPKRRSPQWAKKKLGLTTP